MNYLYAYQYHFLMIQYIAGFVNAHTPYKTILLEDPDVCSEITKRTVKFDYATAINLTQSRLSDHSLRWATSVNCKLRVNSPSKYGGILVVIQGLMFRQNQSTGECIDYIQFKTTSRASPPLCGVFEAKHIMNTQPITFDTQVMDNTFISDHNGYIDVFIHISRAALRSDEDTKINVIFTLFNYCTFSQPNYKHCIDRREYCIHQDYFNDGVINCPFFGCTDEESCNDIVVTHSSVGNKVLIGSATSLALIFIIFVMCLYICRKQKKLCWSNEFSSANSTLQTQAARVIEMDPSPSQSSNVPRTIPSVVPQQEDKDLPPSYESLFPSR